MWGIWYRVELQDSPNLPSQEYLSDMSNRINSWIDIDFTQALKIKAELAWSLCTLFWNKYVDLLDLRGIDLSWKIIKNYDLSYSCLDGANFQDSELEDIGFQFSCFQWANFSKARLMNIQASPIFMVNPSFLDSTVEGWFFENSTIINPYIKGLVIKNSEWLKKILEI